MSYTHRRDARDRPGTVVNHIGTVGTVDSGVILNISKRGGPYSPFMGLLALMRSPSGPPTVGTPIQKRGPWITMSIVRNFIHRTFPIIAKTFVTAM